MPKKKEPTAILLDMFDRLGAQGRRVNASVKAGRPKAQPKGKTARLSSVHWYLSPIGGTEIENLSELFTNEQCAECLVPLGTRTRRKMIVRYDGAFSRRCDGVLAQLPERPKGPSFNLFTKRFLSLLSASERRRFRWRAVKVSNPTKTTMPLFEMVGSTLHVPIVALRGGNPERERCERCKREGEPSYPLVGSLPTWLNSKGLLAWAGQPDLFVAERSLPDPVPQVFTTGDWQRGARLVVSSERSWSERPSPGTMGIDKRPLGVVAPHLTKLLKPSPARGQASTSSRWAH